MGLGQYFETMWQHVRAWFINTADTIGITDVIDMLIVAFVLYKLLKFLRKSRLGLVARSMLLFVAVVWVSGWLNLMVVNFALSSTLELGILALVILFQPEIRQSLERLGTGNLGFLGKGSRAQETGAVIAEIVAACLRMSEERTGALIVFERKVVLEEEINTGTRIDARVSAALLENIFFDKAPLHDGAVIVRGGRLAGAGCILPISDNPSISRDLGLRHRAGIGLSEKSDAVAVMVSEETGSISAAIGGNLRRHLAKDTLETLLRNELTTEDEAKTSVFQKVRGRKKSS
ncbi:MAG: diadenylate cyclase CdaA [Oscillospiraceae bacterium]|nr:diadenylate cyclase CdaA [Oscillospiraceae bacterium]